MRQSALPIALSQRMQLESAAASFASELTIWRHCSNGYT